MYFPCMRHTVLKNIENRYFYEINEKMRSPAHHPGNENAN